MGHGRKRRGKVIDGVLLLDKPAGISSNKALQKCRYLLDAQKAGHTGSLDPLATGLLPLCFGQATKVSSFMLGADKTYSVSARIGQTTDTGDADGRVIKVRPFEASRQVVMDTLLKFIGEYDQVPPMYSALKVNGQPLYKLARQGIEIVRKARPVTAYDIRFDDLTNDILTFEVDCSSGFYVRSLVEDIGKALGCGAHVKALRRTRINDLKIDCAITIDEFAALGTTQQRQAKLILADSMIDHFPKVTINADQCKEVQYGRAVDLQSKQLADSEQWIRIYSPTDEFVGLGKFIDTGKLAPKRLFNIS